MFTLDMILFNAAEAKINLAMSKIKESKTLVTKLSKASENTEYYSMLSPLFQSVEDLYGELDTIRTNIIRAKKILNPSFDVTDRDNYVVNSITPLNVSGIFTQDSAHDLYSKYIQDPSSLTGVETKKVNEILELFHKRGITDENEIDYLLILSAVSGCGHVVVSDMLFDAYKNRPDLFEEQFGYPLVYKEDDVATYNYETVFVDSFLTLNDGYLDEVRKTLDKYSVIMMVLGISSYDTDIKFTDMEESFNKMYPNEVNSVSYHREASTKLYQDNMKNDKYDHCCIAVYDFTLKPYGNNSQKDSLYTEGGHWMSVIGVSKDNNLIVSSWGEEWELTNYSLSSVAGKESKNDGGLVFFKVGEVE